MHLTVHVTDPVYRDEMMPPARFRVVLAQHDAVSTFQMIDGAHMFAIGTHNFHVLLNIDTLEHDIPPRYLCKTLNGGKGSEPSVRKTASTALRPVPAVGHICLSCCRGN